MINTISILIIILFLFQLTYQTTYNTLGIKKIDAVILTTGKDLRTFEIGIESALNHLIDVNRYWIITTHKEQLEKFCKDKFKSYYNDRFRIVDEAVFPFNWQNISTIMFDTIAEIGIYPLNQGKTMVEKTIYSKTGWHLQQLLKFYAGPILGLEDYVIFDSDIIWFKNTSFIAGKNETTNNTAYYYASSNQYHPSYISTTNRISNTGMFNGNVWRSGVCHHLVIKKSVLDNLFERGSASHNGLPFWQVMLNESARELSCRAPRQNICGGGSTLSEYEIYFNFARVHHPDTIVLRPLLWANGPSPGLMFWPPADTLTSDGPKHVWMGHRQQDIPKAFELQITADRLQGYDFIAYHAYAKRRYFELVGPDMDELCKSVEAPSNSTCSWRGIDEAPPDKKRDPVEYFKGCACYMAFHPSGP